MPAMQRPILPRYRPAYTYPGLFRIYLLSPYFHKPCAPPLRPSRTVFYPPYLLPSSSTGTVPRHVLQRNSRDAEIRTRKYGKPKLSSHSNNADWLDLREEPRLAHFNCAIFFDAYSFVLFLRRLYKNISHSKLCFNIDYII